MVSEKSHTKINDRYGMEYKDYIINKEKKLSTFASDLLIESKRHVYFLRAIHASGISLNKVGEESSRRYSELWLPLVWYYHNLAKNPAQADGVKIPGIVPPLDISWLWHCHRLAPLKYVEHLRERFGSSQEILDPTFPFTLQHEHGENISLMREIDTEHEKNVLEAATYTKELWKELYPNEPFYYNTFDSLRPGDSVTCSSRDKDLRKKTGIFTGFDLVSSAERQSSFLWQVSGSNYQDEEFLEEAIENYRKFLLLKSTEAGKHEIIVPTYQIDLIWHTHILTSIKDYNNDCLRLIGQMVNHDDSLSDRTEGSILDRAFSKTKMLWKKEYNCEYIVDGGMYRGEPPMQYFDPQWSQSCIGSCRNSNNFLSLGRVIGASSTTGRSNTKDQETTSTMEWVSPDGLTPDGERAFIPASSSHKRRSPGFYDSNERKEGYIFGKGSNGDGYYHTSTRDSYEIITKRLRKAIWFKRGDMDHLSCMSCLCPFTKFYENERKILRKEVDDLEEMLAVAWARSKADKPYGIVGSSSANRLGKNSSCTTDKSKSNVTLDFYSPDADWLLPEPFLDAAGCGGGVVGGTCGGGAACGVSSGGGCEGGCDGGGCCSGGCGGC